MTPTQAPSPCVEPGCFNLATHKGRCAQCQIIRGGDRVAYDKRRGSPRERGYDRIWEHRRRGHVASEPFCRECGKPGNQVDHVIPHRGAEWLFDLGGNLQTLCEQHHQRKTARERTIPIGMMYPLDLPEPPHYRPIRVLCGPGPPIVQLEEGEDDIPAIDGDAPNLGARNQALKTALVQVTETPVALIISAPRTAERAFWSYVMDCEAELVMDVDRAIDGGPWWNDYMLDQRAEEAIRRRVG